MQTTGRDWLKTALLAIGLIGLLTGLTLGFAGREAAADLVSTIGVLPVLAALSV